MRRLLSGALGVLATSAGAGLAPGEVERGHAAIASWFVDPGVLGGGASDHNMALAETAMLFAATRSVGAESSGALGTILRRDLLGASPYRITLLKFRATCRPPVHDDPAPVSIDAMEAVLEIEHPANPDAIIAALKASLAGARESPLPLPNHSVGHSLSGSGDAASHTQEWTTSGSSLLIGFGAGSLADWLSPPAAQPGDTPTLATHQAAMPHEGRLALQLWIDLNSLRQNAPELFAYGRLVSLAKAWGLVNSRSLLVEGRIVGTDTTHPPLLAIASAWSMRSESLDAIRTHELSRRVWPAGLTAPGAGAAYVAILSGGWPELVNGCIDSAAHLAIRPSEFSTRFRHWAGDSASLLARTVHALGDSAIVLGPGSSGPAAIIPTQTDSRNVRSDVEALMSSLGPVVSSAGTHDSWRFGAHQQIAPALTGLSWHLTADGRAIEAIWTDSQPSPGR